MRLQLVCNRDVAIKFSEIFSRSFLLNHRYRYNVSDYQTFLQFVTQVPSKNFQ